MYAPIIPFENLFGYRPTPIHFPLTAQLCPSQRNKAAGTEPAACMCYSTHFLNTSEALWPPKPSELLKATWTGACLASFGT